ncbi:MAG: hypothetical protein M3209_10690 [Acidobacteriota bacterium]|nr:hypothetical protein [Acidobacteriota bacterium]
MFVRFSGIAFLVTASFFLISPCSSKAADYPIITFEYADLYDRFCADVTKKTIEPGAVEELQNRLKSFREHWRKEAPQLFRTVVKLTKAQFAFGEAKAALSLCNPGSLSFPLIINMRHYLKAINGEKAKPLENFAATVFHETLHRYVNERKELLPGKTTPLLMKYQNEPARVRNHLHLFAILDEVYRMLRRQKDLGAIIASDNTSTDAPIFKRAREIIALEGRENVICEISKNGCSRTERR